LPNNEVCVNYKGKIKKGRIRSVTTNKKNEKIKKYNISFSFPLSSEDLKNKYPNKTQRERFILGNKIDMKNYLIINFRTFVKSALQSSKYNKEVIENKYDEIIKLLLK